MLLITQWSYSLGFWTVLSPAGHPPVQTKSLLLGNSQHQAEAIPQGQRPCSERALRLRCQWGGWSSILLGQPLGRMAGSGLGCGASPRALAHPAVCLQKIFRTTMLFQFVNVLLQVLVHKSHDLLQEEIGIAIYNMASVDFDGFFAAFLPEFLTSCDGVDANQKNVLGRNFKMDRVRREGPG